MKKIILFFAFLIGGIIYTHQCLQNGKMLKFIDQHPHERGIPDATYYIGHGFYLFQNLTEAATYFIRVAERYPGEANAEAAYFYYLQCQVDLHGRPRQEIIDGYAAYLEKFPNGKHAELVQSRLDHYRTGG